MVEKNIDSELSRKEKEYLVIPISSWKEFQDTVAGPKYRNWAFRGHGDADWPLHSSLSRYLHDYNIHPKAWVEQEERILRIFRRKAHLYLDHVPDENDSFQWLALMQHHGAPTRLIDFTWSPFVAAFFALEKAIKNCAVWALCIPEIWNAVHRFPGRKKLVKTMELSLRVEGNYERFFLPNKFPFVTYGEPMVMNKRLIAQAGTFVIPGILKIPVEKILSTYPEPKKTLVKFVLETKKIRDDGMFSLYNMNISNATLFPGLDGMARSLAYELEFHWAFNPKTMKVFPGYK